MTPERWARIREVFGAALEKSGSERGEFVEMACGEDAELRAEVQRMLEGNDEASLQSPVATLSSAAAELSPGDSVAQYRIEARVGEGGMGVVYRAHDTRLDREVALKVLAPERSSGSEGRRRLIQEARAASALNHPNIVTIYEVGSERGVDFIAMEYVEGRSLAQAVPKGGLPAARAIDYAIQIAIALEKAHAAGVIHRDLKPANVMLTADGHVKLVDFGIAQRAASEGMPKATSTAEGQISGTVGYMSPEQIRGLPADRRSDLFSFGVVLYEMVTAERPFTGDSNMAVLDAILNAAPREIRDNRVPGRLKATIAKLLEKDPAERYASAAEVTAELRMLEQRPRRSTKALVAASVAAVILVVGAGWLARGWSRERWARTVAMPQIARMIEVEEFAKAAALAREALAVIPKDAELERLWVRATGEVSIATDPPGAEVTMRPYHGDENVWTVVGKSPLKKVRVPIDFSVLRISKRGFATMFLIRRPQGSEGYPAVNLSTRLRPASSVPQDMVSIPSLAGIELAYPYGTDSVLRLRDFLIDRHEVTNEDYKKFIAAGGYRRPEFWKQPFLKDGRPLTFEESMALFHDATGRPGPATWEGGDYPKGREQHPVAGVSWFEAAAYAEFVGKSLPTAYHWTAASQSDRYTPLIAPGGNFGQGGTWPVGRPGTLSGYGTTDMAGNVKEWCWNEARDGKRFILGGGFGEPEYNFHHTDAHSPWDRLPNFGFRCVKYDRTPNPSVTARIEADARDYFKERPVSDEVFKAYTTMYAYDKGELNVHVEEKVSTPGWTRETITFDAAYGHERVIAHIYLPKNASPPFQTVIYFPAAGALSAGKLNLTAFVEKHGFLLQGGRALVFPIYKGTYERGDGLLPGGGRMASRRDHQIAWVKDLGRTIDYLETRKDVEATKVGYLGESMGANMGALIPSIEKRIKVEILSSGGLQPFRYLPESDPLNFVSHVTIPVLMLNGRYDNTFPLETLQRALFEFLGTPAKDKKHVVYEGGHMVFPRPDAVRECLDWLDRYMGPVRRPSSN